MAAAKKPITLRELKPAEFGSLFPLVQLLNTELTRPVFNRHLKAMLPLGYRAVAAFEGKRMVAASGFWIGTRFWIGQYFDIDNFVVHPDHRAGGIGNKLLDWFEAKAKEERCAALVLDAYATNTQAHRFYHRAGFGITGYHFTKVAGKRESFVPKRFR